MYIVEIPTVKDNGGDDVATWFSLQVLTFQVILKLTIVINPLANIILIRFIFTSYNWCIKIETKFILWSIYIWVARLNVTYLYKSNLNEFLLE